MKSVVSLFLAALLALSGAAAPRPARAQATPYVAYWSGSQTDIQTQPLGGVCLMGGATEPDSATAWFLRRARGGDVVVLRATGTNGYNSYFYQFPGAPVHSVLTLVVGSRAAANDPYVARQVRRAEAVFIAGGDQADYVRNWPGTRLHAALTYLLDSTQAVFGGTSAGCAILGNGYYGALNASVTSAQALANPFNADMTLGANDFLRHPLLRRVVTDTHLNRPPDRRGRLAVFLARFAAGGPLTLADPFPKGVGIQEYTAVAVEPGGQARVFGDFPAHADYAWFVAPACAAGQGPEVLQPGQPLTWNRGGTAYTVYKVAGTPGGQNTFNLSAFVAGTGGAWEHWSVAAGQLSLGAPTAPFTDCRAALAARAPAPAPWLEVQNRAVRNAGPAPLTADLRDLAGRLLLRLELDAGATARLGGLPAGVYLLRDSRQGRTQRIALSDE